MARNRELISRPQPPDVSTSGGYWRGWDSHKFEPLLLSAAFAVGLHAALFSVPVRTQSPPDASANPPPVRSVSVRTVPARMDAISPNAGHDPWAIPATNPPTAANSRQSMASARPFQQNLPEPPRAGPVHASPTGSAFAFRITGVLGDEDFFSRESLDVGPQPTSAVLIDYPQLASVTGTHVSELSLFIDDAGKVVKIRVDGNSLPAAMEAAARSAFMGTVFSPGFIDGLPVRSRIRVEVRFEEGSAGR